VERALEIFVQNNIKITDEIAEFYIIIYFVFILIKFSKIIPKNIDENDEKTIQTLKTVAEKSEKQGNFELAAKLYRQLKDNVKAIICMC